MQDKEWKKGFLQYISDISEIKTDSSSQGIQGILNKLKSMKQGYAAVSNGEEKEIQDAANNDWLTVERIDENLGYLIEAGAWGKIDTNGNYKEITLNREANFWRYQEWILKISEHNPLSDGFYKCYYRDCKGTTMPQIANCLKNKTVVFFEITVPELRMHYFMTREIKGGIKTL